MPKGRCHGTTQHSHGHGASGPAAFLAFYFFYKINKKLQKSLRFMTLGFLQELTPTATQDGLKLGAQ
jgi:hypothetical protein